MKSRILISIAILFLLNNCEKCPPCEPTTIQAGFRVVDRHSMIDLVYTKKYNLDSIQVYYKENNTNIQLEIFSQIDTTNKKVKIFPSGWCQKSISGIKEFYLHLNSSDIDTIRFNVIEQKDKCCSILNVREFKINEKTLKNLDDIWGLFRIYEK